MKKIERTFLLTIPLLAIGLATAPWVRAQDDDDDDDDVELDEAEVFIEFNSTDGDFGIQFFWDGEPWRFMRCEGPQPAPGNWKKKRTVLRVANHGNLGDQALTEGFFESAEPSADELSMEEFLRRFPAGEYEYEGWTQDWEEIEGETELTHVLPAPPDNLWPADGEVVDSSQPLVVTFDAVTEDLKGEELEPELYEVVLETEDEILRVMSVILPGDDPSPAVTVPAEFLLPGGEYKFEVIVQEESGNRTISETEFETL